MTKFKSLLTGLVFAEFFGILTTHTLGRLPGILVPAAALSGIFLAYFTLVIWVSLFRAFKIEAPKTVYLILITSFFTQIFWAFFKAPLDVDGIFYHLPMILESLQKNQWGVWAVKLWHIQTNPKFGEFNSMALIALGGPWGYRLAGFGHFVSGALGAMSVLILAKMAGAKRPATMAMSFVFLPIVIKQIGANYVDIFGWATALAAIALGILGGNRCVLASVLAVGLHAGTKFSGPLTGTAVALGSVYLGTQTRRVIWKHRITWLTACGLSITISMCDWILPNYLHFNNPIYPLNFEAAKNLDFKNIIPAIAGIGDDFHASLKDKLPPLLAGLSQHFKLEALPVYDMGDGAWGLLGLFGVLAFGAYLLSARKIPKIMALVLVLEFIFALTPRREIPRHGFLGGFGFVILGVWIALESEWGISKRLDRLFYILLVGHALWCLPDRSIFRGITNLKGAPLIAAENIKDIIRYGEPQSPGRWFHYEYVPKIRAMEPRAVVIDRHSGSLLAPYYGRHFKNAVTYDASFCRWPMCDDGSLMPPEANGGAGSEALNQTTGK